MANAPVMRLTARRTASSRGREGLFPLRGRFNTASELLASGRACAGLGCLPAAWLSSSSMRWAMISVSVSEMNLWPLAMRAFFRVR